MRGKKDIAKFAKGFDKNPQNINKTGANRKTISKVNIELEADGYQEATKTDIVSCYLRLIQLSIPDLEVKVKDDKQPALIRIVGKAILSGKGFDIIEKMLDRGIGKPDIKLEHSGQINSEIKTIDYTKLSDEDIQRLADIQRKAGSY